MRRLARTHRLSLDGAGYRLPADFIASGSSGTGLGPGVLFVHGWDSEHRHYENLSGKVAALGYACLTFDLRGHGPDERRRRQVTRAENLKDVLLAYDALANWPDVDAQALTIVGTSYGGYLATLVTALRPVQALALRVPALYPNAHWHKPKSALDRRELQNYREVIHRPEGNRALEACKGFQGDVLVIASESDDVLPPASVGSFVRAFSAPHSKVFLSVQGADHALSDLTSQRKYSSELLGWLKAHRTGSGAESEKQHAA